MKTSFAGKTFALAMSLLLGAIPAQAQTVEKDGTKVTAIRDLELNGVTYDVEFGRNSAAGLYGDPSIFDFSQATDAQAAVQAVNDVLNAEGDAFTVGSSSEEDEGDELYRIGFDTFVRTFGGLHLNKDVKFAQAWHGSTPDTGSPGVWFTPPDPDDWPFVTDAIWADFIVVGTTGSGNQPPTANAGGSYTGTAGVVLSFDGNGSDDLDGNIDTYDWEFGDGTTDFDAGPTPSHTYAAGGTYNVILTVTDDDALTDSDSTTATIGEASQPPEADAGVPYSGTAGVALSFDGNESDDPDGDIVQYDWDFGDTTTAIDAGATPSNTYATSGEYTVTLMVTDDDGDTDSDTTTATIGIGNQPPVADAGSPAVGTSGASVGFDGGESDDPDGNIVQYAWDFGDNNIGSGETVQHTYAVPGDYQVILTVTDDEESADSDFTSASIDSAAMPPVSDANGPYEGTVNSTIEFDGSGSSDPDGAIAGYLWDFGDETKGANDGDHPLFDHAYREPGLYTVTLTVTDDDDLSHTSTTTASIAEGNEPPTADPNGPYGGVAGVAVDFDGTGSSDDGTTLQYDWVFGDGDTAIDAGPTPSHTYAEPGTYLVILLVTDDAVATNSQVTSAVIDAANQPPAADANGPYTGTAGVAVNFDGSASSDADGTIVSWDWDFDDGNTGTGETPSNTYAVGGIYTVTLTVSDDDGATSAESFSTAAIDSLNEPPVADANGPYVGKVGVAVDFDGSASDDPDGAITQHDWDFGDGDSAIDAGPRPSHTYETTGVYPVVLTVTDTASSVVQVFVTSGAYTGNLGDQAGGDAACTAAATDAGLAGTWTAWLGKGSCGACMDPKDRIQDGEYQLLDGTIVANNRADLLDGTLDAPINMDETGTTLVGAFEVWTGTDPDGTGGSGPGTCTVWTTNSVETRGQSGTANATDAKWTDNLSETCDVFNRLYCFADVPVENEGATAMDSTQALIGDGVNLPPTADPGGPYPGEEDLALIFDATASDDPDGDIVSWDWNFGDEETGTGETPVHTYAAAGNYLVTLTVADDGDKTDTKTTVAAIGMGNQSPTSDADGPYPGAVGVPVQFDGTGSDDADGYLVSAEWDFGDTGKGSGLVPAHTYMESGPYTATLIVTDNDGATDQAEAQVIIGDGLSLPPTADADGPYVGIAGAPVTFDGSASDDLDGTIERYDWVFGDGSTADDAGPEPDNTYLAGDIYSVILEVTDDDDLVSSDSSNAFIGEFSLLPTADANGPYNGRMGAAVTFDGMASTDPDGTIVSWNWDFGDGNTGTGPTPTNTYASDGSYIVKLTVTDDSSETDTDVTTAAIGRGNLSPVANAGGPYNGATDVAVTFDSTGSGDLDGSIVSYTWDFGDGNTGDGPRPSYTYSTPGTYFVTLTVVDDSDTSDSDGAVAVIGDNQPPVCLQAIPSIERIWPPNHKFVPVTVQGVTDPDGDPVSIRIDSIFQDEPVDDRGDGASSPDGEGVGTATTYVRAERSGSSGNGRVYHIGYTADDEQGGSCSGHVVVGVPHSRKAVVVDDGATFDSTMMGDATGKKAVKKKTRAKKQKDRRRERRTHRSRGAPGP